jgi:uncharacterized protein YjdB
MKTTAKVLFTSLVALVAACSDGGTGSNTDSVAMVRVAAPASVLDVGATIQLTATPFTAAGKPVVRSVAWGSSDEAVATVSQNGLVTAVAPGTVVITATSDQRGGFTTLTVRAQQGSSAVATVEIAGGSPVTLAPGAVKQLAAVTRAEDGTVLNGQAVAWASSDPAVATVSAAGKVTAVGQGTAMISATSEGKTAKVPVVVWEERVASVAVTPGAAVLAVGGSVQLAAKVKLTSGEVVTRPVAWTSTNPAVATVDGSGKVTALATGTTRVTATVEGQQGFADLLINATGF